MFPVNVPPVPKFGPRPYLIFAFGNAAVICDHEAEHPAAWKLQLKGATPRFVVEYHTPSLGFIGSHDCHTESLTRPAVGTKTNVVYPLPVPLGSVSMLNVG